MDYQNPLRRAFIERSDRFLQTLSVQAKTFGNPSPYDLTTVNISYTGMLIGAIDLLPFQVNTILEISIDPSKKVLENPIQCLCKVVRFAQDPNISESYKTVVGVKIIEITKDELTRWDAYLKGLEASNITKC